MSQQDKDVVQRLTGLSVPTDRLMFAIDTPFSLATVVRLRPLIVFFYEETDEGIRRVRAWQEHEVECLELGYHVMGISTQSSEEQVAFAGKELPGVYLLSDKDLLLARTLPLPTIMVEGKRVYEPLTFTAKNEHITHVFYPIVPDQEAADVVAWIRGNDR